jgi:hypothetical protein
MHWVSTRLGVALVGIQVIYLLLRWFYCCGVLFGS